MTRINADENSSFPIRAHPRNPRSKEMKRWPTMPLGELIAIAKGKKAPDSFPVPTRTSLRYLQIEDLRPEAILKYCEPFNCPKATNSDVIIAWDGANAGTVSCNLAGQIGSTLAVLRPTDANALLPFFLSRFLEGNFDYLQRTATGATIPHVSKDALTRLEIPVPPLAEQERIVKLLDEADELRKLRTQADRRTAALIPALFHEMFGDPVANPKSWPLAKLADIAPLKSGFAFKSTDYTASGIRLVRISNLDGRRLTFGGGTAFLPESFLTEYSSSQLAPGDVLVAMSGATTGKLGMVEAADVPSLLNQRVGKFFIRNKNELAPEFLFWILTFPQVGHALIGEAAGSAQPNVSPSAVGLVQSPVPPLALQQEFAARVTEIRAMQSDQAASRQRLEACFQSLLHRAFNGEL